MSVLFVFIVSVSWKAAYGFPASRSAIAGFALVAGVGVGVLKLELVSN